MEILVILEPVTKLSLHEAMIPWRGHLKFRTYNSWKITKYGVLVGMVCEAVSFFICNIEIYSAEKLEDTVLSLWPITSHQNNFYNSVRLVQTLLDRNVRVW